MKKSRFIATILTVTMAFSVTACSSNSEKGEETTAAVTTEASTSISTEAESTTEATTEAKASETEAKASETDAADGTLDASIVGTWGFTVGEGEDQLTIYYTFNEDGSGKITFSDSSDSELAFTYTTPKADTLIIKSSEKHSEENKYKIDGDSLTLDDGIQVETYTRS